jgi:hypothetical protein
MDLILMPRPDDPEALFMSLNVNDMDRIGQWESVDIVTNFLLEPDSFFDVFFGGMEPNQLLLARTLVAWSEEPDGRWFFHVHQAHPPVEIDIKPGSFPNSINLKSKGLIPVAILGSADFDAESVDGATVRFGPNGAEPFHGEGHIKDVNKDGLTDWIGHFKTQETGIKPTDTKAKLVGITVDGIPFAGKDSVRIVGGSKKAPPVAPEGMSKKTWGKLKSK